jgi:hypothetical protein
MKITCGRENIDFVSNRNMDQVKGTPIFNSVPHHLSIGVPVLSQVRRQLLSLADVNRGHQVQVKRCPYNSLNGRSH